MPPSGIWGITPAEMCIRDSIKNVIVVDEDVDIYDPADVMWAVSNRVIPERDIFLSLIHI